MSWQQAEVGKNKLADQLLCLLRCEREYVRPILTREHLSKVQLHRDTTVQSLTVSPTLEDRFVTLLSEHVLGWRGDVQRFCAATSCQSREMHSGFSADLT